MQQVAWIRVTVETSKRNQIRNKHGFRAGFVSPKQTSSCARAFPRFAKRNEGTDRSVCFDVFAYSVFLYRPMGPLREGFDKRRGCPT